MSVCTHRHMCLCVHTAAWGLYGNNAKDRKVFGWESTTTNYYVHTMVHKTTTGRPTIFWKLFSNYRYRQGWGAELISITVTGGRAFQNYFESPLPARTLFLITVADLQYHWHKNKEKSYHYPIIIFIPWIFIAAHGAPLLQQFVNM